MLYLSGMVVEFFVSMFLDNVPDVVVILRRDSDGFYKLDRFRQFKTPN